MEEKDSVSEVGDPTIAMPGVVAARAVVGDPFLVSHADSVDDEDTVSEDAIEEEDSRRWIELPHRPLLLLLFLVSLLLTGVRKALNHERRYSGEGV